MNKLVDSFGRQITYMRLAVTDRCNLRCTYCMPAAGANIVERKELLTFKEMYRITRVLTELGVNKVRLTGGEPFVRKDLMGFIKMMSYNDLLDEINITTNGAGIAKHVEELSKFKVKTVNLSLDSLSPEKFAKITRRDVFDEVWNTFELLEKSGLKLKLNVVVQSGVNTDEINDFVALTKDRNIEVRFIEEMPFNGVGKRAMDEVWNYTKILGEIKTGYPNIETLPLVKSSTSRLFKLEGAKGIVGIIPAYTRTICSDCNRIRLTSTGQLKNCLFDEGVYSIRDFIRNGASNEELKQLFIDLVSKKPKDGFVAEANRKKNKNVSESMSSIGG
ncbi:GTP 3',8-cyclase MoaA [Flavicella sediminum]|uniref:GTP 3',8-cyclase MoaA n=1 Tax=Flavicella sediminum TaxID=2585141 RepID=UPI00112479FB|nr:GTP 3',8-cyclase MoaA [Flavicella sediminum]